MTAIIGQFENDVMVKGLQTKVIAERTNKDGVKEIRIARPNKKSAILKYERPTAFRVGDQPTVVDKFEFKHVYVSKGARDDGLFAKRDIKAGELVSYYSGLISNVDQFPAFFDNQTDYEV